VSESLRVRVRREPESAGEITREDVFIDIGCGMGPVLVEAAARYGFRRVIGVKLARPGAPRRP
jgi:tRNA G46 methylase TrmB